MNIRSGWAAVLGQPHPGRRHGDGQLVGISRPRAYRVQAQPATPRLPTRARRLLPQPGVDLPARSAVVALKQHSGISPRIERATGLAAGDDPDPLEHLIATFGQGDAGGLLPLDARIVVGVEDLRTVERRGHGREQPPTARITHCEVNRLAGKRPRLDLKTARRGPTHQYPNGRPQAPGAAQIPSRPRAHAPRDRLRASATILERTPRPSAES